MAMDLVRSSRRERPPAGPKLACSIGVMAYNEEANIGRLLAALLDQRTETCEIREILVLASGCTDKTEEIARQYCRLDDRVKLIPNVRREGKAAAVNLFLRYATSDILVSVGADTVPERDTIQRLVAPFIDPEVGMTGGHPIPVNDPNTFMGFASHLMWEMHHQIALRYPKLGEITAYRRVFHRIPYNCSVDEANMEPLIRGQGYKLCYVPDAVVRNRGPETVQDFLKQRRRIYAGHLRMRKEQGYSVSTMSSNTVWQALLHCFRLDGHYLFWTPKVIGLEMYGRFLGWLDYQFKKRDHSVWDIAATTKETIG